MRDHAATLRFHKSQGGATQVGEDGQERIATDEQGRTLYKPAVISPLTRLEDGRAYRVSRDQFGAQHYFDIERDGAEGQDFHLDPRSGERYVTLSGDDGGSKRVVVGHDPLVTRFHALGEELKSHRSDLQQANAEIQRANAGQEGAQGFGALPLSELHKQRNALKRSYQPDDADPQAAVLDKIIQSREAVITAANQRRATASEALAGKRNLADFLIAARQGSPTIQQDLESVLQGGGVPATRNTLHQHAGLLDLEAQADGSTILRVSADGLRLLSPDVRRQVAADPDGYNISSSAWNSLTRSPRPTTPRMSAPAPNEAPAPVAAPTEGATTVPVSGSTPEPFSPEEKPFRVSPTGDISFDPRRLEAGLRGAFQAGHIDREKMGELLPLAQKAAKAMRDQEQLLESSGIASKLKALGYGAGKGAAFLAAAPLGAGWGASAGSALGPVGAAAGGIIGGLVTGTVGAFAADKILHKLGEYNDTIRAFSDAAAAHPNWSAGGELISFGAGLPKAGMQLVSRGLSRAAASAGEGAAARGLNAAAKGYESAGGGVVETVRNLAQDASIRTASGASAATVAKAIGTRVGGAAAANVAIDTAVKEGAHLLGLSDEHQTLSGAAQAAAIGVFVSGHNISIRGVSPEEITSTIIKRRQGLDLSSRESEVLSAFDGEVNKLLAEGKISERPTLQEKEDILRRSSGRQALQSGQPYGVTAVKIDEAGAQSSGESPAPHSPQLPPSPPPFPVASPDGQSPHQLSSESALDASSGSAPKVVATSPTATGTAQVGQGDTPTELPEKRTVALPHVGPDGSLITSEHVPTQDLLREYSHLEGHLRLLRDCLDRKRNAP